jgi:hypothetical protein
MNHQRTGDRAMTARTVRVEFARLLNEAKRTIASKPRPNGEILDGSNKSLAGELKISPARVGDFLRDSYTIEIAETKGGKRQPFGPPRLRKAVAGFAASVERTLSWLQREGLFNEPIKTEKIIEGYWPAEHIDEFAQKPVSDGIKEGKDLVEKELQHITNVNVELWIVNWGPFGESKQSLDEEHDFFAVYGSDLLRAIDPINATIEAKPKSLSQILELPARDRRKALALGMGPFETLHRRFRGFEFVTFPAVQFPMIGLLISSNKISNQELPRDFRHFITADLREKNIERVVVNGDVGQLVLLSTLSGGKENRDAVHKLSSESIQDVPSQLLDRLKRNKRPIAFISDGLLAFEMFSFLRKKNIEVEIIRQKLPDPEFLFSLGIMVRKEDRDVAALLEDAQHQIFKSDWRVLKHISNLLNGIEKWLAKQELKSAILAEWPVDAPVFLMSDSKLASYIRTAVSDQHKSDTIVSAILNEVEIRRDKHTALRTVFGPCKPDKSGGIRT